jgi:P-type Mg2+ transporter
VTLTLPYTPFGEIFEFRPLPVSFLLVMGLIVGLYTVTAELVKKAFYRRVRF